MATRNAPVESEATEARKLDWFNPLTLLLCLIGVGIAGYLSYTRLFNQSIVCVEGGGCDRVNSSSYAFFLGIPVSYLGLLGYITMAGLVIARWRFENSQSENAGELRGRLSWGLFIISLVALVFSGYLMSMSFFVIKATCIWCVSSAITVTILFILFASRLWRSIGEY